MTHNYAPPIKKIAIGDVIGAFQFTHIAAYHAGIVIKNALLRLPAKADRKLVPWVTFTSPELLQVSLNELHARQSHGDKIKILRWFYTENDRAQAEGATKGMKKAITTHKRKILGCGIVDRQAGELIQPWVLALTKGMKIVDIAQTIALYLTSGEVSKHSAGSYYTPFLYSQKMKKIVRFLA